MFQKFVNGRQRRGDEWEEAEKVPDWIKQHELNEPSHNQALIHWNGNKGENASEIMFILTRQKKGYEIIASELWISSDYGKTWRELEKEWIFDICRYGLKTFCRIRSSLSQGQGVLRGYGYNFFGFWSKKTLCCSKELYRQPLLYGSFCSELDF